MSENWPFVLGVTGGIGSGKSAATDHIESLGITVVDADLAARVIMEPGKPALTAVAEHFGEELILADGSLDRAALRTLVFADPDERLWLEQLTHPLIGEEILRQITAASSEYVVLASPLLLEGAQHELCDKVLVIDVPENLQIERTMARDENSREQVERIMAAQLDRQARLARADFVIENTGTIDSLHDAVEAIHHTLMTELGKSAI